MQTTSVNKWLVSCIFAFAYCFSHAQTYTINSGGTVSTCSGTFYDSGGSGSNYGNSESYTMTFCPSTAGQVISVNFTSFATEDTYDFLYIYDGNSTAAPLIGQFSGTLSLGTIKASTANASGCLTFKFTSDGATKAAGWAATISCAAAGTPTYYIPSTAVTETTCQGTFYDDGGPNSNYVCNGSSNFTQTVTFCPATAGSAISVNFTSFSTESGYDYLYIYDGSSTGATLIGKYSGTGSPGTVTASASNASGCLTFKFVSDAATTSSGWVATVSCLAGCSGTPTAGTANASVTNGCANYSTVLSLSGATTGTGISYQWQSSPNGTTWTNISGATAATATTTVSGTTYYHCVLTCSNGGASATSTSVQANINCIIISTGGTVTACNATFYDDGGSGSSYSDNKNYTMTICPATAGQCIQAIFTSFATEGGYDFLTIYDGSSTSSSYINTISGTLPQFTVTASTSNASGCLTFSFTSDGATHKAGWAANISCGTCGSPYPAPNTDCKTAYPICGNQTFPGTSNGAGSVSDISNANVGCLNYGDPSSAEHQSAWYYFKSITTGTIGMSIAPSNPNTDYDWAIWGPMNPISCPPSNAPVRCSSGAPQASCSSNSGCITGMSYTATDVSDGDGCSGDQWTKALPVIAGDEYVMMIDNWNETGDSYTVSWQLNVADLSCDIVVLPVELINFVARREEEGVALTWQTLSEINAAYFYVERSPGGTDFETITSLKAAGNSSKTLNYSILDKNPLPGISYYRLKQVDYNGNYKHSMIASVDYGNKAVLLNHIRPNPANTHIDFDFYSPVKGNIRIELLDNYGRLVNQKDMPVVEGKNTITTAMENLPSGIYLLHVTFDEMSFNSVNKIIKQ